MSTDFSKATVFGLLAIGLGSISFAPILVRFAPDTSPLVLVAYRTGFAAIMLLPFWLWFRNKQNRGNNSSDRLLIAISGACLGLHFTCWVASVYYTSIASASVLVTVHPIIMILVERLWFKRSFATTTWVGVGLAFCGSLLLGVSDSQMEQSFANPLWGNFLALSAALIFVVYLLIGQQIRQKRSWIDYVFPVYFYAAATCLAIAIIFGKDLFDISTVGLWAGAGLAFGPQIVGHGSMNYAVKYISPTLISTLILAEPLLASILAFVIFAEVPPVTSIIAMCGILCGVGLTWKRSAGTSD